MKSYRYWLHLRGDCIQSDIDISLPSSSGGRNCSMIPPSISLQLLMGVPDSRKCTRFVLTRDRFPQMRFGLTFHNYVLYHCGLSERQENTCLAFNLNLRRAQKFPFLFSTPTRFLISKTFSGVSFTPTTKSIQRSKKKANTRDSLSRSWILL